MLIDSVYILMTCLLLGKARTSGTKNDKGQADPWPLAISEIE
jgi:hypothetical protein